MTVRQCAIEILDSCKIPAKLKGYDYLVDAIEMCYNNNDYFYGICKLLYPEIAKLHNVTGISVERCIRKAISTGTSKATNQGFIKACVWFIQKIEKPS